MKRTIIRWFVVLVGIVVMAELMRAIITPWYVGVPVVMMFGMVGGLWVGLRKEQEEKK